MSVDLFEECLTSSNITDTSMILSLRHPSFRVFSAQLTAFKQKGDSKWYVSEIYVPTGLRNKGVGNYFIDKLKWLSDKNKWSIIFDSEIINSCREHSDSIHMNSKEFCDWLIRHDFKQHDDYLEYTGGK